MDKSIRTVLAISRRERERRKVLVVVPKVLTSKQSNSTFTETKAKAFLLRIITTIRGNGPVKETDTTPSYD